MKALTKKLVLMSALLLTAQAQARTINDVCSLIASRNASLGTECIKAISNDTHFNSSAAEVCFTIANAHTMNGLNCVKAIASNDYERTATEACDFIASYNSVLGVNCMKVTANKSYPNHSAELCLQIANSSINEGLRCLNESGIPMSKVCPTLPEISWGIGSALDSIYKGLPRRAVKILEDMKSQIDTCLRNS